MQVNEAMAKSETLDRELNTQKEILKQMESTKKEHIGKLKIELNTADERYQHIVQENAMIGEDYRSRAAHNFDIISEQKVLIKKQKKQIKVVEAENLKQLGKIERFKEKAEGYIMEKEDVCGYYINLQERTKNIDMHLKNVIDERQFLKDQIVRLE
jgi:hypothetical protein